MSSSSPSVATNGIAVSSPADNSGGSSSSIPDIRCPFCSSKTFARKLDLARHLEESHSRETCLYDACANGGQNRNVFTGHQGIVVHVESAHSRPSVTKMCVICGKNMKSEMGLTSHILSQHLERSCGMCTFKYVIMLPSHEFPT